MSSKNVHKQPPPLQLCNAALTDSRGVQIVEKMRQRLAKEFGVTVIGNSVTLRMGSASQGLQIVSMIITDVTDDNVCDESMEEGQ